MMCQQCRSFLFCLRRSGVISDFPCRQTLQLHKKKLIDTEIFFNAVCFLLSAKNATRWNSTYFISSKFLQKIKIQLFAIVSTL